MSETIAAQRSNVGTVVVLGGDAGWPVASLLHSVGVDVLDAEAPPKQIDTELVGRYGFLAASVRAGTLGDLRLVSQQVSSALKGRAPEHLVWTDGEGIARDALRAGVEPGADSAEEVMANHLMHLEVLRAAVQVADLVVLPLRAVALVEDKNGTIFPAPLAGMKPPKGCKTKAFPAEIEATKSAFAALLAALRSVRPHCKVQLVCLGNGPELSGLRAMAAALVVMSDGVRSHPIVDELISRLHEGDGDFRLGVLLSKLLGASDVIGALTEFVSEQPPEMATDEGKARSLDKAEKRARREARAKRKEQAGTEARVVCEDELLEAFS